MERYLIYSQMKTMRKFFCILLSIFFCTLFISAVQAHQPRIVYRQQISQANPVHIKNPEVSQAFYAELRGQPEYYKIISDGEFNLYVRILSPKIADAKKDFSVEISTDSKIVGVLTGSTYSWTEFYEPFVGDDYWQGPEFEQSWPKGEYLIKVYNSDNRGKYVLVVGKAESFPISESLKLFVSLPRLKHYFGKSGFTAFFNLVGLFLLILIVVFAIIVYVFVRLIKIIKKKMLKTPL
jgi:hypothetical protein